MAIKILGMRLCGYSNSKPLRQGTVRYGQGMLKSPLDKTQTTAEQERNNKAFNKLSIRIKDFLGFYI